MFKAVVAAALIAAAGTAATPEDWTPAGPIKLLIAFAAGGGADTPITTTAGTEMAVVALASKVHQTLGDVIEPARGGEAIRLGTMSPARADLAHVIGKHHDVESHVFSVRGGRVVMDGLNAGEMVELASAGNGG